MAVNETDQFLVNRAGTTYTQEQGTLMANLENDDLLLVNREGTTYTITGQDFVESVVDPLELSVNIDIQDPEPGVTLNVIASPSGGKQPYTPLTYQWKKRAQDSTVSNIDGATSQILIVTDELVTFRLACEVTVSDSFGTSVTTLSEYTEPVDYKEVVNTPELITPPDGAGLGAELIPESGAIVSATTEGPAATMYGLRFDEERQTSMTSPLGKESVNSTLSVWVKETGDFQSGFLHTSISDQNTNYVLDTYGGSLTSRPMNSMPVTVTATLEPNTWNHIVISKVDQNITFYLNGENKGTAQATSAGLTYFDGINPVLLTGINGASGKYNILDGYMSDLYFVDGYARTPSDFAYDFEGTWVALPSAEVYANIQAVKSPADLAPNRDQKWSTGISANMDYATPQTSATPAQSFFDGVDSLCQSSDGSPWTITFSPPVAFTESVKTTSYFNGYVIMNEGMESETKTRANNTIEELTIATGTGSLNTIKYEGIEGSYPTAYNVTVDGRQLNDGPADTSQVWSSGVTTGTLLSSSWATAFNGKGIAAGIDNQVICADSSTATLTFPTPAPGNSVVLYGIQQTVAAAVSVICGNGETINSSGIPSGGYGPSAAINISGKGGLKGLQISSDGVNRGGISAVELDGKVLIDTYTEFNTSQIFSDGWDDNARDPKNSFKGNNFDNIYSNTGIKYDVIPGTATWTGSVPIDGSVELNLSCGGVSTDGISVKVNDIEIGPSVPLFDTYQWITVPGLTSGNLTKIEIFAPEGKDPALRGVRINGVLLVDGATFGTNGFHLPFDPAAEAWAADTFSNYISSDNGTIPENNDGTKAFDGSLTEGCEAYGDGNTRLLWDYPIDGKLELYRINGGANDGDNKVSFDGGAEIDFPRDEWVDFGFVNADQLVITDYSDSSAALTAVRYKGVILVDGEGFGGVGVDASGQGNHFVDENFAIGNTSKMWSELPYSVSGTATQQNWAMSFDGNLATLSGTSTNTETATFTFAEGLSGELEMYTIAQSYAQQLYVDGVKRADTTTDAGWYSFGDITGSLTIGVGNETGSTTISAFRLDGVLLIDGDVVDTVTDTPISNYAVLPGTTNGGLKTSGSVGASQAVSFAGEDGVIYYYEVNGEGKTALGPVATITPTANANYNFGQMPFRDGGPTGDQELLVQSVSRSATLEIADAGTLDSVVGYPTMTAKTGGAKGTYVSHTNTELVLSNVKGDWSAASEKAISDVTYTIAAIDPNNFVMSSSDFSVVPSDIAHRFTTWQVTELDDEFYQNPVINVTSESALISYNASGLEPETTYRARVKHTSENGVDSLWSEQRHQNVFKTEVAILESPNATMSGLRLDQERQTTLSRTFTPGDTWTVSFWYKPTANISSSSYLALLADSGTNYIFNSRTDGFSINGSGGGYVFNYTWKINEWVHIVIRQNSAEVQGYVNGVSVGSSSGAKFLNEEVKFIGYDTAAKSNGYLSDVYFVDGYALMPTDFGAMFPADPAASDRRWGPLDSSVVYNNIAYVDVPDGQNWNTSQIWSAGATTGTTFPSQPWSNAFDGVTTIDSFMQAQTDATLTLTEPVLFTKLRIAGGGFVTLNGVRITLAQSYVLEEASGVPSPLETISVETNSTLSGIEVDGELLVDLGNFGKDGFHLPFNTDAAGAIYQDAQPTNSAFPLDSSGSKLFDGDLSTNGRVQSNSQSGEGILWKPDSDLTGEVQLFLRNGDPVNSTFYYDIGGGDVEISFSDNTAAQTGEFVNLGNLTITAADGIAVSHITLASTNSVAWAGIMVNGVLLVNHSPIGVDASGQGNHFVDENFAVGNTSQVWSKYVNVLLSSNISSILNNPIAMFNGGTDTSNLNNLYGINPSTTGESWEINYPSGVITNGTYTIMGSNPSNIIYRFTLDNGTDINSQTLGAFDNGDRTEYTITIPDGVSLTKVTCENDGISSANTVAHFYNGEMLINPYLLDMVDDTPMSDYSVLVSDGTTGTYNGNLVGQGTNTDEDAYVYSTQQITTGKYYWEVTPLNGDNSGKINPAVGVVNANNLSEMVSINYNNLGVDYGDTIGVFYDTETSLLSLSVNGLPFGGTITDNGTITGPVKALVGFYGAMKPRTAVNFGQHPFVYAPPEGYLTLYQTWDEYATFGTFFYNENTDEVIQAFTLQRRYGLTGAKPEAGIYELSVQPNFAVAAYVKEDNVYVPIENPESRIAYAEEQAAADVAAAEAETAAMRNLLIKAACAWEVAKAYVTGDVIEFNGKLYQALTDGTSTADDDPGDLAGNWLDLNIEVS